MNKYLKVTLCNVLCCVMCFIFLLLIPLEALAAPPVEAPSYILMEASTGQII